MTTTNDLTRLATALGWKTYANKGGEYVVKNHGQDDERVWQVDEEADLDAFLKAAEAALSQEQSREYGLELARRVPIMPGGLTGDMYFAIASAPAEVRLRALRAVCDRSPHTAGRGRWNQR